MEMYNIKSYLYFHYDDISHTMRKINCCYLIILVKATKFGFMSVRQQTQYCAILKGKFHLQSSTYSLCNSKVSTKKWGVPFHELKSSDNYPAN